MDQPSLQQTLAEHAGIISKIDALACRLDDFAQLADNADLASVHARLVWERTEEDICELLGQELEEIMLACRRALDREPRELLSIIPDGALYRAAHHLGVRAVPGSRVFRLVYPPPLFEQLLLCLRQYDEAAVNKRSALSQQAALLSREMLAALAYLREELICCFERIFVS